MALPALALWGLTAAVSSRSGWSSRSCFARGTVLAVDNPARQAFVSEIVGSDRVVNAVALNSVIVHSSRIVGPAAAGTLIALVGVAACFAANAASFLVMLVALRLMDPARSSAPRPSRVSAARCAPRSPTCGGRRRCASRC